ncbi:MAG: S8 family serine peptidase [Pseudomonadota bacterium]
MRSARTLAAFVAAILAIAACTPSADLASEPPRQLLPTPGAAVPAEREVMVMVPLSDGATLEAIIQDIANSHGLSVVALWPMASIELYCAVLALPDGDAAARADLLRALEDDERIALAQPMNVFQTTSDAAYDDPLFDLQTGFVDVGALAAHEVTTGRGVTIAVVDTGIDTRHPDLGAQVERVQDLTARGEGVPGERHGTALAGIIAAVAGNGQGIVGIAPDARILGLRGCWETGGGGRCSSFTLARALNVAVLADVDVVNLSLTGPFDPTLALLIDAAVERGMVIVAAYDAAAPEQFPADRPGVVAVAATAGDAAGAAVPVVVAPGASVLTTLPGRAYGYVDGASAATAYVAGLAALFREIEPTAGAETVRAALVTAAPGPDACRALRTLVGDVAIACGAPAS